MNKRVTGAKCFKFALIGIALLAAVYLTANIAVSRYKAEHRQRLVAAIVNKIEYTQDELMTMMEGGSRAVLRSLELECSSFGGYMGEACWMLLGDGTQGGWDLYARAFAEMDSKSGAFDEREIRFMNQAYELNASLLSELTAREHFSKDELSLLISRFAFEVQQIVFTFL